MGSRRTRKKERKRASKVMRGNPFGSIAGVPAFQPGGTISVGGLPLDSGLQPFFNNSPPVDLAAGAFSIEAARERLRADGLFPVGGGLWMGPDGAIVNEAQILEALNNPLGQQPGSGTGNSGASLALSAEIQRGQLELAQLTEQHTNAINIGNLALAREIEARAVRAQASLEALQNQQLQLQAATAQGTLGLGIGNLAQRRNENLQSLLANPRDSVEADIALGGGRSLIGGLLSGQGPGARSTQLIGDNPTLGSRFAEALRLATAQPEQDILAQAQAGLQLGPSSVLNPVQRSIFDTVSQANSNVRPDQAVNIARNPDAFRRFVSMAQGGTLVTDEPIVGIGQISGRPRFTLGENFEPELVEGLGTNTMKVTPLAHGGTVKTGGTIAPPTLTSTAAPPAPQPGGTDALQQAVANFGRGGTAASIAQAAQAQAPAPAPAPAQTGFPSFPGIQALIQFMGRGLENAIGGFGQGTGAADILRQRNELQANIPQNQGEAIRRLSRFSPRQFNNLLPSDRGRLASVVSALGTEPDDFFTSLLRSFASGPDPSRVAFGTNF